MISQFLNLIKLFSQTFGVVYDLFTQAIFSMNKIENWNFVGHFNNFCLTSNRFQILNKKLLIPKRCVIHKKNKSDMLFFFELM